MYFSDDVMDGFYLSPMFELKQYNFKARMADVNAAPISRYSDEDNVPRLTTTVPEYMHCYDFTINAGGHYQLRNHLVFGWNVGFGLRNAKSQRLDLGTVDDQNPVYVNHIRQYSATRPLFTFDFTLGGWF
jgi:hypothetical protein